MNRALAALTLTPLLLAASPAAAQEVYGGVFTHGAKIGITACCYEGGSDLQLGVRTPSLYSYGRGGDISLYALGSANTAGGVSFASAGIALKTEINHGVYFRIGLGAAVQNGSAANYQVTPNRLYLGSRFLFQPEGGFGYQLNPRWALEATYTHLSHGQLAGPQNPGLDDLGLRAVYRFGK
jgi:lipid A 3-O-deacylase